MHRSMEAGGIGGSETVDKLELASIKAGCTLSIGLTAPSLEMSMMASCLGCSRASANNPTENTASLTSAGCRSEEYDDQHTPLCECLCPSAGIGQQPMPATCKMVPSQEHPNLGSSRQQSRQMGSLHQRSACLSHRNTPRHQHSLA